MNIKNTNVVNLFEGDEYSLRSTRVLEVSEKGIMIEIEGLPQNAGIAFSCLIRPEPGDHVLYAKSNENSCIILSIIERSGCQDMSFSFQGNVDMNMNKGAFSLISNESITMATGDKLNCISKETIHKSRHATIDFDNVVAKGSTFLGTFKSVNMIGQVINRFARRLTEKAQTYIRHSEDYDEVKAGNMNRKSEGLFSVKSENSILISKNETVIDGEHIFTGL